MMIKKHTLLKLQKTGRVGLDRLCAGFSPNTVEYQNVVKNIKNLNLEILQTIAERGKTLPVEIKFIEEKLALYFKDKELRRTLKEILDNLYYEKKYFKERFNFYTGVNNEIYKEETANKKAKENS